MANLEEFYVELWNPQQSAQLLKFKSFSSLWYEDTIDKGAQAQMTVPFTRVEVTRENFDIMNRVRIYKGSTLKWSGFINRWSFQKDTVSVEFLGLMSILEKRLVTADYPNMLGSAIAADIISDMNGVDDTGITFGSVDGSVDALRSLTFSGQTVLGALRSLSDSLGAELYIDLTGAVRIVEARGSDKSNGEVDFKMLDGKPNETNIQGIDVIYDGSKLYNKVTGHGTSLSSTQQNAGSQTEYGLLEQTVVFGDVSDQTSLDEETITYVNTFGTPIEIPKISPISERIDESEYDVGDSVSVRLEHGFYELDDDFRIVSKRVTVRNDKQQTDVEVGLSDRAQSRADILSEIAGTNRRVYNLERV